MAQDAGELMVEALGGAAERMAELAQATPVERLGETRHLTPALRVALEASLSGAGLRVDVASCALDVEEWRSRARVDLGFDFPEEGLVLAELKWGEGRRALGECAWDLAKLGVAVARGRAARAFIVAGSSERRWLSGVEGTELFESGEWPLTHLRGEPYMTHYWAKYARERLPQPNRLPAVIGTRALRPTPMLLRGQRWELRASEVIVERDGDLIDIAALPTD